MGVGVTHRRGVLGALARAGGVDGLPMIDGPRLDRWNPQQLADALDQELARCATEGWPRISLHMDVTDAMTLARFLRRP